MKFFSKASNYCLVLKPGLPGNRMVGEPPKPGLYVKFQHGVAEVNNEEHIELMLSHPKFGVDFFQPDSPAAGDPYSHRRAGEVQHDIVEFEYGQPKRVTSAAKPKISPQLMKFIEEQSTKMAEAKFEALMEAFQDRLEQKTVDVGEVSEEEPSEEPSVAVADPIEQQSDDKITDEEVEEKPKKKAATKKRASSKKK